MRSTLTRAYNLFGRSGLSGREFLARLEEARAITWTYQNRVTRCSLDTSGRPQRNLLPYCFAVFERLLTAKGQGADPPATRPSMQVDEPVPEPNPLWRAVLHELRTIVAPSVLARCQSARVVHQRAHVLQVEVPDRLTLHWFETCLRRALDQALTAVGQSDLRVQFVL